MLFCNAAQAHPRPVRDDARRRDVVPPPRPGFPAPPVAVVPDGDASALPGGRRPCLLLDLFRWWRGGVLAGGQILLDALLGHAVGPPEAHRR